MEIRKGKSGSPYRTRGMLHFMAGEKSTETEEPVRYRGKEAETQAFRDAVGKLSRTLDNCYKNAVLRVGETEAEIFAAQKMMLTAEEFTDPVLAQIAAGACAMQAVGESASALADTLAAMDTEYMRARAADVLQLAADLRSILCGQGENPLAEMADKPYILAAHDLSPAQTIGMDVSRILGFVTEGGSGTSHTAILARSMHIPAVVSLGKLDPAWEGHDCIVDGETGVLLVDPDAAAIQTFATAEAEAAERAAVYENLRHIRLRDGRGRSFPILANAGSLAEVRAAAASDAEGIGLFRSEFLFLSLGHAPSEEEQLAAYKETVSIMAGGTVIVRTLDAGADKALPWMEESMAETNPALGCRAVRLCLRHPEILVTQLRALYRAAVYGPIAAMIPMITLPRELAAVQKIAAEVRAALAAEGIPYNPDMPLGIMIETPSAALLSEELAKMADFFSIGTNDLMQYTLAADRENAWVADLAEPLPESVRILIRKIAAAAVGHGIPVSICGELGADTRYIPFFVDCGIRKLSVSPGMILPVRKAVAEALAAEDSRL